MTPKTAPSTLADLAREIIRIFGEMPTHCRPQVADHLRVELDLLRTSDRAKAGYGSAIGSLGRKSDDDEVREVMSIAPDFIQEGSQELRKGYPHIRVTYPGRTALIGYLMKLSLKSRRWFFLALDSAAKELEESADNSRVYNEFTDVFVVILRTIKPHVLGAADLTRVLRRAQFGYEIFRALKANRTLFVDGRGHELDPRSRRGKEEWDNEAKRAEEERDRIVERTLEGELKRLRRELWPRAEFLLQPGYRFAREEVGTKGMTIAVPGKVVPEDEMRPAIQKMVDMYIARDEAGRWKHKLQDIATVLGFKYGVRARGAEEWRAGVTLDEIARMSGRIRALRIILSDENVKLYRTGRRVVLWHNKVEEFDSDETIAGVEPERDDDGNATHFRFLLTYGVPAGGWLDDDSKWDLVLQRNAEPPPDPRRGIAASNVDRKPFSGLVHYRTNGRLLTFKPSGDYYRLESHVVGDDGVLSDRRLERSFQAGTFHHAFAEALYDAVRRASELSGAGQLTVCRAPRRDARELEARKAESAARRATKLQDQEKLVDDLAARVDGARAIHQRAAAKANAAEPDARETLWAKADACEEAAEKLDTELEAARRRLASREPDARELSESTPTEATELQLELDSLPSIHAALLTDWGRIHSNAPVELHHAVSELIGYGSASSLRFVLDGGNALQVPFTAQLKLASDHGPVTLPLTGTVDCVSRCAPTSATGEARMSELLKAFFAEGTSISDIAQRAAFSPAVFRTRATRWLEKEAGVTSAGLRTALLGACPDTRLAFWCAIHPHYPRPTHLDGTFIDLVGQTYIGNDMFWPSDWIVSVELDKRRTAAIVARDWVQGHAPVGLSSAQIAAEPEFGLPNTHLVTRLDMRQQNVLSMSQPDAFIRNRTQRAPGHPPTLHRPVPVWTGQTPVSRKTVTPIRCAHCGAWATIVLFVPELYRIGAAVLCPDCFRAPTSDVVFPASFVTESSGWTSGKQLLKARYPRKPNSARGRLRAA